MATIKLYAEAVFALGYLWLMLSAVRNGKQRRKPTVKTARRY